MVIYRVSNVYLSCIYRICNVVDSGNSANYRRALKAQFRGEGTRIVFGIINKEKRTSAVCELRLLKIISLPKKVISLG